LKNLSNNFNIIVKTVEGLETVLADELVYLGANKIEIIKRAVRFDGNMKLLYSSNLHLRTALRVLLPIHRFQVRDAEDLYQKVIAYDWHKIIRNDQTFAIDSSINSSPFNHGNFVALKTKDAIVDRIRMETGARPSVDRVNPDIVINVHIFKNDCNISLDSSGHSLHKRGYRQAQTDAPLNEVLAAGLLKIANWKGETAFYDPMCGSGTFTSEAFGIACGEAPGKSAKFSFMNWENYDNELWNSLVRQSIEKEKQVDVDFYTSDIEGKAVAVTKLNMRNPRMRSRVKISNADFFDLYPKGDPGLIILNPPYGERIQENKIGELYKKIGNKLKFDFPRFEAWILLPKGIAEKSIGLKPDKKTNILNGAIKCNFNKFSLFQGKRKDVLADSDS